MQKKKPKPINPLKPNQNKKETKKIERKQAGPTWETWFPKQRRVGFWGESCPQNGAVLGFWGEIEIPKTVPCWAFGGK